ncbi:MAG TPA: two-component system regulatory protein YycI [Thermoclostridium sp.]|nr:two-component system regulatory protein YycI [Thermoclostridium sp.]
MEWSKAKSILIFLFVILNIFLLFSIIHTVSDTKPGREYVKLVNNLLESKNIRIACAIPSCRSESGSIVYREESIDENRVVTFFLGQGASQSQDGEKVWKADGKVLEIGNNSIIFDDASPDTQVDIGDREALTKMFQKVFQGLGLKQGDYVPDIWEEKDGKVHVRYVKKYKGQLLFDIYADFIVSADGIEHAAIMIGEVSHTIGKSEVLSAWHLLAVSNLRENLVITDIAFGFKRIHEGELYDSPVWRIRLSDGSEIFYNAYTGEEI